MARNPIERALGVWSAANYRNVMLPGLGVVTCGEFCDVIADLKAENERLAKERQDSAREWRIAFDNMHERAMAAERALAERAGGVKGEWHRADGDKSILLYTLRQDGWRKGEAVMVNDVTVRIEAANGSESPIEPIASAILSALTTEPAAPEGRQEAVAWMWEEVVDPTGDVIHGGTITRFATHWSTPPSYAVVTPLYTRPAEQAVTDEMVEAAVQAVRQYTRETLFIDEHRELVRAALKAAMEAGR